MKITSKFMSVYSAFIMRPDLSDEEKETYIRILWQMVITTQTLDELEPQVEQERTDEKIILSKYNLARDMRDFWQRKANKWAGLVNSPGTLLYEDIYGNVERMTHRAALDMAYDKLDGFIDDYNKYQDKLSRVIASLREKDETLREAKRRYNVLKQQAIPYGLDIALENFESMGIKVRKYRVNRRPESDEDLWFKKLKRVQL